MEAVMPIRPKKSASSKMAVNRKLKKPASRAASTLRPTRRKTVATEKTKYLSFRVDKDYHQRAMSAAVYAYHGNLSELLDEAVKQKLAEIEEAQEAALKSRLHLSKDELKMIAAELDQPSDPTEAFIEFMNKDHLDHKQYNKNIESILSGIQNRKA